MNEIINRTDIKYSVEDFINPDFIDVFVCYQTPSSSNWEPVTVRIKETALYMHAAEMSGAEYEGEITKLMAGTNLYRSNSVKVIEDYLQHKNDWKFI